MKNPKQKLFSFCLLWSWIEVIFGNLCPQEALAISNLHDTKCTFWRKNRRCAQLWHYPERACKDQFYKLVCWKKCAFWTIRPEGNVLFRWGLKDFSYCFNSVVLLILVHKHWVEVIFFCLTSGFGLSFQQWCHSKVRSKYLCAVGCFEKTRESWIHQCKLHVGFTGIKHFSGGISLKPMLMYD